MEVGVREVVIDFRDVLCEQVPVIRLVVTDEVALMRALMERGLRPDDLSIIEWFKQTGEIIPGMKEEVVE